MPHDVCVRPSPHALSGRQSFPYHRHPVVTGLQVDGLSAAESILGSNVIGPEAVSRVLHVRLTDLLTPEEQERISRIPFDDAILRRAAPRGTLLILRVPRDRGAPLSIRRFHERFPSAFEAKSMTEGVGYSLRSEWAVTKQGFAAESPELGWRLVTVDPLRQSRGRSYARQDAEISAWAGENGLPPDRVRRRKAVEAVYDFVVSSQARGLRLLTEGWDWTRTQTDDGAFVTVGNVGADGLRVLAYSTAVKFASLGVCPEAT